MSDSRETGFGVLGPLSIVRGDADQPFPSGRLRALLATFLLHAGELVSPQYLTRAVWDEHPPDHPLPALATLMTRLRGRLADIGPDAARCVQRVPGGYVFSATAGQLDTAGFRRSVDLAFREGAAGRLEEAETHLSDGLGRWRGRVLPEVASSPLRHGPITGLEDEYLLGVERKQALRVLLGSEVEQIDRLRRLILSHPEREVLNYHLALALHRAGRSGEALLVLQRTATYLREEFGVDPGDDLRRLHHGIVSRDERLVRRTWETIDWLPGLTWLNRRAPVPSRP